MSSEWYCWMLINNFVANINKYRQRTFVPGGHLEADETVVRWYGKGGTAGLPMYLVLKGKPDNSGEIQNLAIIASGIMLHLKLVKSANEETWTFSAQSGDGESPLPPAPPRPPPGMPRISCCNRSI